MIYPGQIYKASSNDVSFLPVGDLYQVIETPSASKAIIWHFEHSKQRNFEGSKKTILQDQIKCYAKLVFDLKSLVVDSNLLSEGTEFV